MTSKKIIALMLTLCMLLSCISVFAAEIAVNDTVFPEEGLTVKIDRHIWEPSKDYNLLLIVSYKQSELFPVRATVDHYAGITVSFDAAQKTAPEGSLETFTVVEAPVYYTRKSGSDELCLGIKQDALIAASPELSQFKAENPDKANGEIIDTATLTNAFTISNVVLKQGTWKAETVSTGVFTEDTILLSHKGFQSYPSTWNVVDVYGEYKELLCSNAISNDGPHQFFVPEVSGEYNVYVQLISNASPADRLIKLKVNGEAMTFDPKKIETSKLPSSMLPVWCAENDNKTITLKAGEVVDVMLLPTYYGRVATIAFVPVADNAAVSAALAASPTTVQVSATDITTVAHKAYHPAFDTKEFLVTVNGKNVAVLAGRAAKKDVTGTGYIHQLNGGNRRALALAVRVLPETNTFPTYATVYDAIAKYINDNQGSSTLMDVSTFKNGGMGTYGVTINGKVVTSDLDWYEVKAGDEIVIIDTANKAAFAPTSLINFATVTTGGLITAIGTPTVTTIYDEPGKLKLCLHLSNTTAAIGSFAANLDDTGLKGCYLVGYMQPRKEKTGNFDNLDMNSKVYFENVPILDYNKNSNGTLNQGSGRIDLVTGGRIAYNANDPRYKDADSNPVTGENGKYLVKPYEYYGIDSTLYDWSNVYIVNSSTDLSLTAKKGTNKYVLSTGGCHVVDIVIATYAEDGKTITNTSVIKEQIVMTGKPVIVPIEANQKAFVWKTEVYGGTTMVPAVPTLLGANF